MTTLPGVEYKRYTHSSDKIHLKENPVGGFVGITQRGPLNQATHITDYNQFLRIFGGLDSAGYLPFSVYSFFQNGGESCYVVRVAHSEGEGRAKRASFSLNQERGGEVAKIEATTEGSWGNNLECNLWFTLGFDNKKEIRANLTICLGRRQEDFLDLSLDPDKSDFIGTRVNEKSGLVNFDINDKWKKSKPPQEVINRYLFGGREGLSALTPGDFIGINRGPDKRTGLAALEPIREVNLLAIPDVAIFLDRQGSSSKKAMGEILSVHQALISHAEQNPGRFALLDISGKLSVIEAMKYREKLDSSHAAVYYPDLKVLDPADNRIFSLPPSCAMAGIISRMDKKHGTYYPPGNRFLEGAVGQSVKLKKQEMEMLYDRGINSFKKIPGKGVKIWGVRTLSSDGEWRFINVRRTISFLTRAIRQGTAWAVFEPNGRPLEKRVVRHVTAYLIDVWRKGYLAGKTAEEAFYIKCDEELNPPENIDAGILTVQIGLCVVKPAEYIVVTLQAEKENTNVIIEEEIYE